MLVPATPYRGIRPFRYVDHAIFFAREHEAERLTSLVSVYRGTMLYGASGTGKSSLINAGLLPRVVDLGFHPERVRVQPRAGEALVLERIPTADDGSQPLPSLLAGAEEGSGRVVLCAADFEQRVRAACVEHRPLIVFDQFEELCTLFGTDPAGEVRQEIVDMIVRLLHSPLPVKLLFVFREDYLGQVKELLAPCPELVDQALLLGPLAAQALTTIIRGPFDRHPGHFARELDRPLVERLRAILAERFGAEEISLSEVQTVCLRLWQSEDPQRLLAERGVQGLLEDYLGEALDAFPPQTRFAAVALLGQMVTAAGTRNVISAGDLVQRVREEDPELTVPLLEHALERLDRESRLVRREPRRDIDLYEITSEFLVPWISSRREESRRLRERRRDRRRLLALGSIAGVLLVLAAAVTVLALWALHQSSVAHRESGAAHAAVRSLAGLVLSSAADEQSGKHLDASLLLALGAYEADRGLQARDALMRALAALRGSGPIAIMHGHTGPVAAVAVAPDGRSIASAGYDQTVRLWSVQTHRQIGAALTGHTSNVNAVAFSPDGKLLASGSDDHTIRIWDIAAHKEVRPALRGHEEGISAIAISPRGKLLASAGWDQTVRIWDLANHQEVGQPLHAHAEVNSVAFSPDGRTLLTGTQEGTLRLWSVATHHPLGRSPAGHTTAVSNVAFNPNGQLLASASDDNTIRFWSLATGRPAGRPLREEGVSSIAFSPDGRTLASAGWDETVRLWSVASRQPIGRPLQNIADAVLGVAFLPGGRTLVTAGRDGSVRLWSTHPSAGFGLPLGGHFGRVEDVAFSPDGRTLAFGSDNTVRLWSVGARRPIDPPLVGHTADVQSIAFSPNGRLLASGADDGTVRLWNPTTHRLLGRPLVGDGHQVSALAFSHDGRTLAAGTRDGMLWLWDVATGTLRRRLRANEDGVSSLAFGPRAEKIATGGRYGTLMLWNARTGERLGEMPGNRTDVDGVAFSPDGSRLATASADESVRLWDVATRHEIGEPLRDHRDRVFDVAFAPSGDVLASAGADDAIRLWSVNPLMPLGSVLSDETPVRSVAFSPDGTTLASAGADGMVRLWPGVLWRSFPALRAEVCHVLGAGFTPAEWAQYVPSLPYRNTCP